MKVYPSPRFFHSRVRAGSENWKGINVLNNHLIKTAHSKNLKIHVWTINSKTEMKSLIDMKVDGIMTDEALLLKEVCLGENLF